LIFTLLPHLLRVIICGYENSYFPHAYRRFPEDMIIPLTNMIPPKRAMTIATYGVYDMILELKFISAHV